MPRFKETQVGHPQGREMRRPILERVIEAQDPPVGAVPVPDDTPLSDWVATGYEEYRTDGS